MKSDEKYEVVYSGGTQAWQNTTAMLQLAKASKEYAKLTFLSHDWESLKKQGQKMHLPEDTGYEFCEKSKLYIKYSEFDFGLVLRDDTPVNRVACPTKLYEYMSCGVIPIVRTENMGDFKEFGYSYITESDFMDKNLPGRVTTAKMLKDNYAAVNKMKEVFKLGSKQLVKEAS